MSTFNGKILEIPDISVDRFNQENLNSKLFFLSHCHEDHMEGLYEISKSSNGLSVPLYASPISILFIKRQYPTFEKNLIELDIGHTTLVQLTDNCILENLYVTALPAGHCPGSVMFLFEFDKMKILYTGDIRLSVGSYKNMKKLHSLEGVPVAFDNIYLDTTFFHKSYKYFPSQFDSFEEIFKISKHWLDLNSNNIVLLKLSAKYGSEYVFIEISKRLSMPIHVSCNLFETYKHMSEIDTCVTLDSSLTRIHACEYNKSCKTYHDGDKKYKLYIKPSAMFWTGLKKGDPLSKTCKSLVRVCYSSHASYDELIEFLIYFKPKLITPCVVLSYRDFHLTLSEITERIKNYDSKDNKSNSGICENVHINKDIYLLKKIIRKNSLQVQNKKKNQINLKRVFEVVDLDDSDEIEF